MTVWIYEAGRGSMKVFASQDAAEEWFAENDPEGVAFEHPVIQASNEKPGH
jgi:hypothetical protein